MTNVMKDLWKRLEAYARSNDRTLYLRPPATERSIKAAEKTMRLQLPEDYRASLLLHDGQDDDQEEVPFEWMPGCAPLKSLDLVIEQWRDEKKRADDPDGLDEQEDGILLQVMAHPRRIPIAGTDEWDGDNTYIDLLPSPEGDEGQLITFTSECDLTWLSESFSAALERYLVALEGGDWLYNRDKAWVAPKAWRGKLKMHRASAFSDFARKLYRKQRTAATGKEASTKKSATKRAKKQRSKK